MLLTFDKMVVEIKLNKIKLVENCEFTEFIVQIYNVVLQNGIFRRKL